MTYILFSLRSFIYIYLLIEINLDHSILTFQCSTATLLMSQANRILGIIEFENTNLRGTRKNLARPTDCTGT